jgi:uncharacterized protein
MARTSTATTAPRQVQGQLVHTEFMTEDPRALMKFLEKQFQWKFETHKMPDGEYHTFTTPGGTGGGIGEPNRDQGQTIGTTSYILVEDIQATAKALKKGGAEVIVPPLEIPGFGWMLHFRYKGSPVLACYQNTEPE